MRKPVAIFSALFLLGAPLGAYAQSYPNHVVRIIAPGPAGGGTDIVARFVAPALEKKWGKSVIVENISGAGTAMGSAAAARAAPDGHTLLIAPSSSLAIYPSIAKEPLYDAAKDLRPVALLGTASFVVIANSTVGIKSISDLVARAKANPSAVMVANSGPATPHHLFAELFQFMTDTKMQPVSYRGSSASLADLTGGTVHVAFMDTGSALPFIKSGKVRPLAVTTASRVDSLPDVPTVAEAGVPGYEAFTWIMLAAPAGTPDAIVEKINADMREILATEAMKQHIQNFGMTPDKGAKVPELNKLVAADTKRFGEVVKAIGLSASR